MDPLVSTAPTTTTPEAGQSSQPTGRDVTVSLLAFLGADEDSQEAKFILDNLEAKTALDGITQLKDLERRLGPAKYGETRVGKLYNYMRVLSTFKQSKKELERLER